MRINKKCVKRQMSKNLMKNIAAEVCIMSTSTTNIELTYSPNVKTIKILLQFCDIIVVFESRKLLLFYLCCFISICLSNFRRL